MRPNNDGFRPGDIIRNIEPYAGEPAWLIDRIDGDNYVAKCVPVAGGPNAGNAAMNIESTNPRYSRYEAAPVSRSVH